MKTIYLIETNMNIEFDDGTFTGWEKTPVSLYAFTDAKKASEEIIELRKEELERYKQWLKERKKCFIHHQYSIRGSYLFD